MSSVPESQRYAPPTAHVEDVAVEGRVELAGRGTRFVAWIIDVIAIGVVVGIIAALTAWSPFRPANPGRMVSTLLISFGSVFIAFTVVQGVLLATRGQTLGKLLLGIRIVRTSGERAGFGRLVALRYGVGFVLNMLPFIGGVFWLVDCLLIFRESRQCVHDNIADTIVVRA